MSDNVDNIVLEQLRLIRKDMPGMRNDLAEEKERVETLDMKVDGVSVILENFGANIHALDERVGHIEEKLGIE